MRMAKAIGLVEAAATRGFPVRLWPIKYASDQHVAGTDLDWEVLINVDGSTSDRLADLLKLSEGAELRAKVNDNFIEVS